MARHAAPAAADPPRNRRARGCVPDGRRRRCRVRHTASPARHASIMPSPFDGTWAGSDEGLRARDGGCRFIGRPTTCLYRGLDRSAVKPSDWEHISGSRASIPDLRICALTGIRGFLALGWDEAAHRPWPSLLALRELFADLRSV